MAFIQVYGHKINGLSVRMFGKCFSLSPLGFKINHLDLTPRFAGILMSFTNCFANFFGLLAPIVAGNIIEGKVNRWSLVKVLEINSMLSA